MNTHIVARCPCCPPLKSPRPNPIQHYTTQQQGPVDLIVAADVVWLDELVAPLAKYLRAVLDRPGSRHAGAYMCTYVWFWDIGAAGIKPNQFEPDLMSTGHPKEPIHRPTD